MAAPTKSLIKKVVLAIKKSKRKYLPVEALSREVGLYSDVLTDALVYFEPLIKFDASINTKDLLPQLEEYLAPSAGEEAEAKPKRVVVTKKELLEYASISDFVYKKYATIGGLIDKTATLSENDLKLLQKLVALELDKFKKPKKKKKKAK